MKVKKAKKIMLFLIITLLSTVMFSGCDLTDGITQSPKGVPDVDETSRAGLTINGPFTPYPGSTTPADIRSPGVFRFCVSGLPGNYSYIDWHYKADGGSWRPMMGETCVAENFGATAWWTINVVVHDAAGKAIASKSKRLPVGYQIDLTGPTKGKIGELVTYTILEYNAPRNYSYSITWEPEDGLEFEGYGEDKTFYLRILGYARFTIKIRNLLLVRDDSIYLYVC